MNDIKEAASLFLLSALGAVFTRSVLLGRAFGADTVAGGSGRRDKGMWMLMTCVCSLISAAVFWAVLRFLGPHLSFLTRFGISNYYASAYMWPLEIALSSIIAYLIAIPLFAKSGVRSAKAAARELPFACFNTFMAGTLMINAGAGASFVEAMGFAAGSAISYCLVCMGMDAVSDKLDGESSTDAFRGLPARLLYLAGLAMLAYAFTGHRLSGLL